MGSRGNLRHLNCPAVSLTVPVAWSLPATSRQSMLGCTAHSPFKLHLLLSMNLACVKLAESFVFPFFPPVLVMHQLCITASNASCTLCIHVAVLQLSAPPDGYLLVCPSLISPCLPVTLYLKSMCALRVIHSFSICISDTAYTHRLCSFSWSLVSGRLGHHAP